MKQQIIISGKGGQGVIFLTHIIAEAAIRKNLNILTSETHGMAQRGGTVISHIKVGDFKSPLIMHKNADVGIFLNEKNIIFHKNFLKDDGKLIVNSKSLKEYLTFDAESVAKKIASLVSINLILLGYAVGQKTLFCDDLLIRQIIKDFSKNKKNYDVGIKAFNAGFEA